MEQLFLDFSAVKCRLGKRRPGAAGLPALSPTFHLVLRVKAVETGTGVSVLN